MEAVPKKQKKTQNCNCFFPPSLLFMVPGQKGDDGQKGQEGLAGFSGPKGSRGFKGQWDQRLIVGLSITVDLQ